MSARTIARVAIGGAIGVVRFPIDQALRLAGDGRFAETAQLTVDRGDASVRAFAGAVLGDEELRKDALRSREAAHARERATKLEAEAEARREKARHDEVEQ